MSAVKIELIDLEKDWKSQTELVAKTYSKGKDYILNNRKFFEWFFKNPFVKGENSFMVIKSKGKIISEMGLVPTRMKFFDKTVDNVNLVNLMALEEFRGKGTGFFLYKEAEKFGNVCTNTGYGPLVVDFIENMGWVKMPDLNRFVLVLNGEKASKLAGKKLEKCKASEKAETSGMEFVQVEGFGKEAGEFWERVKEKYPITIERSAAYLNWRFSNHPVFDYKMFEVRKEGRVEAVVVLHFEEADGFRVARIVDFVSGDRAELFALEKAIEFCKEKDVDLVDFFFSGKFHVGSLGKAGFVEAKKGAFGSIPMLFSPIDRERKSINFAFKAVNKKLLDERINNFNNWYITKADGDQDRPN